MKENIVRIKEGQYRYRYDPATKKTEYLGPVGSSPQISEEDFQRRFISDRGEKYEGLPGTALLWNDPRSEEIFEDVFGTCYCPEGQHDETCAACLKRQSSEVVVDIPGWDYWVVELHAAGYKATIHAEREGQSHPMKYTVPTALIMGYWGNYITIPELEKLLAEE